MSPTDFAELDQIGSVIYKRLRQNVRAERAVLLGSNQDFKDDRNIWAGFLKAAATDGEKIIYYAPKGMGPALRNPAWETVEYDEAEALSGDLLSKVRSLLKARRLIVLHAPTKQVSHLVSASLAHQLDKLVQHPVLSISTLRFALSPEEHDSLQTECLDAQRENEGTNRLSCASQKVSRKYQRKNLDAKKLWAIIERHGLKEYLVFIHNP